MYVLFAPDADDQVTFSEGGIHSSLSLSSPLPIDSKRLVQIMALNMFVIEHAKAKSSLGVTGGPAFKGERDSD